MFQGRFFQNLSTKVSIRQLALNTVKPRTISSSKSLSATAFHDTFEIPDYSQLRNELLREKEELTRDQKRALRRRTGPVRIKKEDKVVPKIDIEPVNLNDDTVKALKILKGEKLYGIVEIKQQPYYVQVGDVMVLPRMNDLNVGDVISLDRISEIGSSSCVLKGNPFVHPNFFKADAVVISHEFSQINKTERKKKRGQNTIREARNAHTLLRVSSLNINI